MEGTPDSPLVVRLSKGETGEGLMLPRGPAEGVLGGLVGEPWATAAEVSPQPWGPTQSPGLPERSAPSSEPAASCPFCCQALTPS